MRPLLIAIDGPAGSGKTTLGAELARRLGYILLDAGVLYRVATYAALQAAVSIEDIEDVQSAALPALANVRVERGGDTGTYLTLGDTRVQDLPLYEDSVTEAVPGRRGGDKPVPGA